MRRAEEEEEMITNDKEYIALILKSNFVNLLLKGSDSNTGPFNSSSSP